MDHVDLGRLDALDGRWPLSLHAPFTLATARTEGLRSHHLRRLVKAGLVRHLLNNVYVAATRKDSTALRCEALALVVPDDCVVVDRHAGWLLGAEMVLAPNEHLELRPISMFRPSGRGRLRNDLAASGERNLLPQDVTEVNGVAVTTPIRTAWDLGRTRWTDQAIAGIDAMLGLGAFPHEELIEGIERFRGMRWITTLRAVGPLGDGRAQSPGESVLRLRWIETRLPTPHPQLHVWRGDYLLAVLDIANADLRFGAEYNGEEWHSSPRQVAHDAARAAELDAERWLIKPFVAADVFGRNAGTEAKLRAGAAAAVRRFRRSAS